jgi:hypothetical protein
MRVSRSMIGLGGWVHYNLVSKYIDKFVLYLQQEEMIRHVRSGTLQIGIRAHGFHTELGWAMDLEFGVKITQGIDVQNAKRVLGNTLDMFRRLGGIAV